MIKRIILFQFRDSEDCIPTVREKLHSMQQVIPEILSMETGADIVHSGRSYDMALIATFANRKALERYDKHPYHQEVRKYIHAHRTASVSCDFEV